MRIVAINGSPRGRDGNTNVLVTHLLKGAAEAGSQTSSVFLAEKTIKHCRGCHTCWQRGPGQCVIVDDMPNVVSELAGANVIVFASPVQFENISGMLKVFMDRMTMIGGPHSEQRTVVADAKHADGKRSANEQSMSSHPVSLPEPPKLVMVSSCGYADPSEFDVTSLWIRRVAEKMHFGLAAEIYVTQGKYLKNPPEDLGVSMAAYLTVLEQAGIELAVHSTLAPETYLTLQHPKIWP